LRGQEEPHLDAAPVAAAAPPAAAAGAPAAANSYKDIAAGRHTNVTFDKSPRIAPIHRIVADIRVQIHAAPEPDRIGLQEAA
jgi:hypothetical protein